MRAGKLRWTAAIGVAAVALSLAVEPAFSLTLSSAPGSPFGTGGLNPGRPATADFNRDGNLDVVLINFRDDNSIAVLLGDGRGRLELAPGSPFTSGGSEPYTPAVGDFNGDLRPDLAIPNRGSNNVSVLLGLGDGRFAPVPGSPFATSSPFGTLPEEIAVGDFDNDGNLDAAVVDRIRLSLLLGDGQGRLTALGAGFYDIRISPWRIAAGDLNRDGNLDVAMLDTLAPEVGVLLGDGAGGFRPPDSDAPYWFGGVSIGNALAVGDMNADDVPDVAVTSSSEGITVMLGNGTGRITETAESPFPSGGAFPISLALGDVDGDSHLDAAVANRLNDTFSLLLGHGDGRLSPAAGFPRSSETPDPVDVAFGDFNGDGRLDLLIVNGGDFGLGDASVFLNTGPPARVVLAPRARTQVAGGNHCVTATVEDAGGTALEQIAVRFSVTGANTASGSVTSGNGGTAQFCFRGTRTGVNTITAWVDLDADGAADPSEPADTATHTYVPARARALLLTPDAASTPVGASHCVAAALDDLFGNPIPNVVTRFAVTGAVAASGAVTTDANGRAAFCYAGPERPGLDEIHAFADLDGSSTKSANEPGDSASNAWVPGAPAAITAVPVEAANPVGSEHRVSVVVTDKFANPAPGVVVRFATIGANPGGDSARTDPDGRTSLTYSGATVGLDRITAFADTDVDGIRDTEEPHATVTNIWYSAPASGSFVIGDRSAAIGADVLYRGPAWASENQLSGGDAPSSFKGFAADPSPGECGRRWTASPGNPAGPAGPLPEFMPVRVASLVEKTGATISGDTAAVVVVRTSPQHGGTGRVVAQVCVR